eukprot:6753169-Pyramimonas_sp.AAC.1
MAFRGRAAGNFLAVCLALGAAAAECVAGAEETRTELSFCPRGWATPRRPRRSASLSAGRPQ